MGVKERREREKQDLRQEILDAARELFVRDGYEAVSMRKIADQIEYSPTTIYLHFRDKSELFDCLAADTFGKLLKKLEAISCGAHSEDPVECLRHGLKAYIEFGLEHPDEYKITFLMAVQSETDPKMTRRGEVGCEAFSNLRTSVGACIQAGRLRVINQELASQALWAGVHGLTSLLIVHPHFPWVERETLIDGTIDTLLKGIIV
jgi:AcrR family transcriptional regulator